MADNSILIRLDGLKLKYEEIGQKLTDPEVIADVKLFIQLTKEYKELEPIIETSDRFRTALANLAEGLAAYSSSEVRTGHIMQSTDRGADGDFYVMPDGTLVASYNGFASKVGTSGGGDASDSSLDAFTSTDGGYTWSDGNIIAIIPEYINTSCSSDEPIISESVSHVWASDNSADFIPVVVFLSFRFRCCHHHNSHESQCSQIKI